MGHLFVAGVDEVGMGCLAGPVIAAAVILDQKKVPAGINDSKKLSPKVRERLAQEIRESALTFAIGEATVEEIDSINILQAARLAMVRAVRQLSPAPTFLLVDGRGALQIDVGQRFLVGGDGISLSIGAASIIAKVYRDKMMQESDGRYPGYDFAKHKGYGSEWHRRCLQEKGPSPFHRKTFSWTPV